MVLSDDNDGDDDDDGWRYRVDGWMVTISVNLRKPTIRLELAQPSRQIASSTDRHKKGS